MEEKYMRRAIELARLGTGFVNPNPLVGAVIVRGGRIIGEGRHERYGGLHAERNAIAHLTESAEGADMYVTLEPCCHHGKQPPCTEAILAAGIKRVYIGSYDPNPLVSGKGTKFLRAHGVEVFENVLRAECDALNDIFFHYITTKRPYVIAKAAVSIDGRTATRTGDSKWISNELSRADVHLTRKRCAAIMCGIGTVTADDPMLSCRCENPSQPIRVICDSRLRISPQSRILRTAREYPTIIATVSRDTEKQAAVRAAGADVIVTDGTRVDLAALMAELGRRGIDSVLAEGGAAIHGALCDAGLIDEIQLYIAPKLIGGADARSAVGGTGAARMGEVSVFGAPHIERFGDDIKLTYKRVCEGRVWS